MTEHRTSEMDDYYRRTRRPLFQNPTTTRGKIGCGLLVFVWFCVLMLPFLMFWLASGRSVTIPRRNVPDANEYPVFRLSLIMSKDNRGLHFITTDVQRNGSNNLCVEAHINYLLWASDGEDNMTTYCDCFERSDTDAEWVFLDSVNTSCNP
jgi:hypothetical protein